MSIVVVGVVAGAGWRVFEEPMRKQRDAVRQLLNDPDSAVFRNERRSTVERDTWCGEVNARNQHGGMNGFVRYMVTTDASDPKKLLTWGEPAGDASARLKFEGQWLTYCTER